MKIPGLSTGAVIPAGPVKGISTPPRVAPPAAPTTSPYGPMVAPAAPVAPAAATPVPPTVKPPPTGIQPAYQPPPVPTNTMMKYGLDTHPVGDPLERATLDHIVGIKEDGEAWGIENPLDVERTKTIANNPYLSAMTPGGILASSEDASIRKIGATLAEDPMGASGRHNTVAIRKRQYEREYVGNTIIDYETSYVAYRNGKVGSLRGVIDDYTEGKHQKAFDDEVFIEIENRNWGKPLTQDLAVKRAADSVEEAFERMRLHQIENKTVGWAKLPDSSIGYITHKTSPGKFLQADNEMLSVLHKDLRDQFMKMNGMDPHFADKVAGIYLQHIRTNANGGHSIPANVHDPATVDYVRRALLANSTGMTRAEIEQFANLLSAGGPSHTKTRLKLDLTSQHTRSDGTTFRLMDLFETNALQLIRNQSNRVSGEVALAQNGIMGAQGLKLLEQSMHYRANGGKANLKEIEAFQQIAAELLGRPYGDATPQWLENAMSLTASANLGMMGFQQVAEYTTMMTGLGFWNTMKAIGGIPRLISEVHLLAKGMKIDNPIIGSMELPGGGGEFGLDGYKMVMSWDAPSAMNPTLGHDGIGTVTKLIRSAGHGVQIASANRLLTAIQTRGAAEQIVHKVLKYTRDGIENKALADMGFTPELVAQLKAAMPTIASFSPDGRVQRFDITKWDNVEAASAFRTSVLRGASQLIQGAYIGEIGKWQHNSFGKILTQFRTFPILALTKQWGRNRAMHGSIKAATMVLAVAPFAVMIAAARAAYSSIGREDQDEYLEKALSMPALGKAIMNHVGMLNLTGDFVDGITAALPESIKKEVGLDKIADRHGRAPTLGSLNPLGGQVEKVLKYATDPSDPHKAGRLFPGNNLPPALIGMNMIKEPPK